MRKTNCRASNGTFKLEPRLSTIWTDIDRFCKLAPYVEIWITITANIIKLHYVSSKLLGQWLLGIRKHTFEFSAAILKLRLIFCSAWQADRTYSDRCSFTWLFQVAGCDIVRDMRAKKSVWREESDECNDEDYSGETSYFVCWTGWTRSHFQQVRPATPVHI